MTTHKPKLLDQVRAVLRKQHYSPRTEETYVSWIRQYILYHKAKHGFARHPNEMGASEIDEFLIYLANEKHVAASTQNQALSALLFLYRKVLDIPVGDIKLVGRANRPDRLPTVLTQEEVKQVLDQLHGTNKLVAQLLYGCGLRISECVKLRIKDIDFAKQQIIVRDGKGNNDRVVMLPISLIDSLQKQLEHTRNLHNHDLERGYGRVQLPFALARKYPNADKEWRWQFAFPSTQLSKDKRDGVLRRFHTSPSTVQRAVKQAAKRTEITKQVTCHTFRHSFATHLLEAGYDIRTIQKLMGHKDVKTTMIYTHVMDKGVLGVHSPIDQL